MSFETLVKRISPTLKRITYKLNGHFSYFNDEDLYQEALVHLWQDFKEGRLEGNTDSYILQGCYFHLRNYIRKAKEKTNLVSLDTLINEEGTDLEDILCLKNPNSCFDDLDAKILLEGLQNNGLTEREKEILSLCAEVLTTREMGQRLGISHVRVIKLKNKIKAKCQRFMSES